jgi:hypothetical protein
MIVLNSTTIFEYLQVSKIALRIRGQVKRGEDTTEEGGAWERKGERGTVDEGGRGRGGREGFIQLGLNEAGTVKSGSILIYQNTSHRI